MRVRVLVAGVYNGPDHHDPVRAQPGDVIEVAGGWYAAELVEKGLVTADTTPAAPTAIAGPDETQVAQGPGRKPAEPRSKKLSEIRKLSDLKDAA